uniref:Uncharacterized protein n=1 Tax=Anguilla anguilla TaxID=7936 RepID=A0A0E9PVK5_ANGAN
MSHSVAGHIWLSEIQSRIHDRKIIFFSKLFYILLEFCKA